MPARKLIIYGLIIEILYLLFLFFFQKVIMLLLLILALSLFYYLSLKSCQQDRKSLKIIIFFSIVFVITFLLFQPLGSYDIYEYIFRSRILSFYHENPYLVPPASHSADPFFKYIDGPWQKFPLVYGPVWLFLSWPLSQIAGANLPFNIFLFRLEAILFGLGCAFLIYVIVKIIKPGYQNLAVLLFAWNPFVLFEVAGNGHNDIMVAFFTLLAIFLYLKDKKYLVIPALVASILIKYVAIIALPIFILLLVFDKNISQKAVFWIKTLVISFILIILFYLPVWGGWRMLNDLLDNTSLFGLPFFFPNHLALTFFAAFQKTYSKFVGNISPLSLTKFFGLLIFLLLYTKVLFSKDYVNIDSVLKKLLAVFVIFLLFGIIHFLPWYLIWVMPLVILIFVDKYQKVIIFFTLFSLLFYTFY